MRRKVYDQLKKWKEEQNGESAVCLIREKVVTFRMVKLNLLLSIFLITK